MCGLYQLQSTFINDPMYVETSVAKPSDNYDPAVAVAFPEIGNNTCIAMQKLLTLVISSLSFRLNSLNQSHHEL